MATNFSAGVVIPKEPKTTRLGIDGFHPLKSRNFPVLSLNLEWGSPEIKKTGQSVNLAAGGLISSARDWRLSISQGIHRLLAMQISRGMIRAGEWKAGRVNSPFTHRHIDRESPVALPKTK